MARILYVAKIAVDRDTGLPIPALAGQSVQIVARGTTTPVEISEDEAGSLVISGSTRTVSSDLFIPSFWVDESLMPVSAYGGGVEVPLETAEGIALRLDDVEVDVAASAAAAIAAQAAAETAASAVPPGGTTGQVLVKASNADRHTTWATGSGGGGGVTSHGALSGLTSGDDHTQYHNDARGDARYYTKSQVDSAVASAATQTSASDRARANHTGTQPLASVTNLETELAARAPLAHAHNASTDLTSGTVPLARLGTNAPSGTLFLRGDNTWASAGGEGGGGPVAWDDVADKPTTFTPAAHNQDATTITSGVLDLARIPTLPPSRSGLGAVNNTADLDKPISTDTQNALNLKANASATVNLTGTQTIAGTKTFSSAPVVPDGSFTQAKISGLVTGLAGKVGSTTITTIWTGSQSAYDAIGSKDSATLYLVTGA